MKVLLRSYNGKYYVWKDATYKNDHFIVNYPGYGDLGVNETDIIAVKDDNRSGSVSCSHCGTVIKNDPVAIEAHFAEQEAKKDCFQCPSLRRDRVRTTNVKLARNDYDDNFEVVETYTADLRCAQTYWKRPQIDTDEAKKICVHYRCRNSGVREIKDTFTKYPGLFDKHVTVDVLNAKKCAFDGCIDGFFEYDLKCRNTVKACVNKIGIVDHFIIKARNHRYIAYYSAKYDKLFFHDGIYNEDMPYDVTETKYKQAKDKIAALYKEEESK